MKSMILCMSALLALTVFASFANNQELERKIMAERAALADRYGEGQSQEQLDRFQVKTFVPENLITEREEDTAKSLFLGAFGKH